MSEAPCLLVPKRHAQEVIQLARKLALLNVALKVKRKRKHVIIPLIREPTLKEAGTLNVIGDLKFLINNFEVITKPVKTLIQALEGSLPHHLFMSLPRSMDIVGEVAIIEVPKELKRYKRLIGEAVLEVNRKVKAVLGKAGAVAGELRLRDFELIAGTENTETVHKEYGCIFHLDPLKVYFSPRLSYEHHRIAQQARENEVILDMFAGVGPFSIQIAKHSKDVKIYAIDLNPEAYYYLERNVVANKVVGHVMPVLGDSRTVIEGGLFDIADRVVMNLPEKAIEFIDVACKAIKKKGGFIHYYEFQTEPRALYKAKKRLGEAVSRADRRVESFIFSRLVRPTDPYRWQVVVDAFVR